MSISNTFTKVHETAAGVITRDDALIVKSIRHEPVSARIFIRLGSWLDPRETARRKLLIDHAARVYKLEDWISRQRR